MRTVTFTSRSGEDERIYSVGEYVREILSWGKDGRKPNAFRGQAFWGWKTTPKLFRPNVHLYDHEKSAVRDLISIHPQEFNGDNSMFDRLVRMQHYNLPTRLLDVTLNPLVALWFATEEHEIEGKPVDGKVQAFFVPDTRIRFYDSDRVSCMANLANLTSDQKSELFKAIEDSLNIEEFRELKSVKALVSYVRMEKPHFENRVHKMHLLRPLYVKPKMSNRRILAQTGAFLLYGKYVRSTEQEGIKIERLVIAHERKAEIRKELAVFGINASTLFPEIDKAATIITERYNGIAKDEADSEE